MNDNPYQGPESEYQPTKPHQAGAVTVNKIGVLSAGKVMACLYALLGLIVGGIFAFLALIGAAAGGPNEGVASLVMGLGSVIFLPIFYGVLGFLGVLLMAVVYNLVASVIGGLEIEMKPTLSDLG
jgi:hypothetical protein